MLSNENKVYFGLRMFGDHNIMTTELIDASKKYIFLNY